MRVVVVGSRQGVVGVMYMYLMRYTALYISWRTQAKWSHHCQQRADLQNTPPPPTLLSRWPRWAQRCLGTHRLLAEVLQRNYLLHFSLTQTIKKSWCISDWATYSGPRILVWPPAYNAEVRSGQIRSRSNKHHCALYHGATALAGIRLTGVLWFCWMVWCCVVLCTISLMHCGAVLCRLEAVQCCAGHYAWISIW